MLQGCQETGQSHPISEDTGSQSETTGSTREHTHDSDIQCFTDCGIPEVLWFEVEWNFTV